MALKPGIGKLDTTQTNALQHTESVRNRNTYVRKSILGVVEDPADIVYRRNTTHARDTANGVRSDVFKSNLDSVLSDAARAAGHVPDSH